MKILILIAVALLCSCSSPRSLSGLPFSGHTKHKPIKRMTKNEWIKAESGHSLYVRENGKVFRNSGREWTVFKRPDRKTGFSPKYKKRTPIFNFKKR